MGSLLCFMLHGYWSCKLHDSCITCQSQGRDTSPRLCLLWSLRTRSPALPMTEDTRDVVHQSTASGESPNILYFIFISFFAFCCPFKHLLRMTLNCQQMFILLLFLLQVRTILRWHSELRSQYQSPAR